MKKTFIPCIAIVLGIVGCAKEEMPSLDSSQSSASAPATSNARVAGTQLIDYVPAQIATYPVVETFEGTTSPLYTEEATRSFYKDATRTEQINVSIGDFTGTPKLMNDFIAGKGLRTGSGELSGLAIAIKQASENANIGFALLAAQSSGQGAVAFAQATSGNNNFNFRKETIEPVDQASFVRPFSLDLGVDVGGWEIYDAQTKVAMLILHADNKYGVLIEATNQDNIQNVLDIASGMDFAGLTQ